MATAHPLPVDPVAEALARPFVATMPGRRRVQLEADLRAMWARVPDACPYTKFQEALEARMGMEEHADDFEDLTPEELEEIDAAADEAEEDARAGRTVSWDELRARLGP